MLNAYLQFSTANSGKAEFRPDPDWAIRDLLHRAYYSQRIHRKTNGKYAATAADLGLKDKNAERLSLDVTRTGFEATATIPGEKGAKPRRLTIAQDSLIRRE
jgi:hypothetical protein